MSKTIAVFGNESSDRAVSPVIGVILMVAITVILAAVIGAFVLGLGDQVQETAPNANFDADWEFDDGDPVEVTITHSSGETLDPDEITVFVDGDDTGIDQFDQTEISAGDSTTVTSVDEQDDEVTIIWESGGQSSTLATFEVPD